MTIRKRCVIFALGLLGTPSLQAQQLYLKTNTLAWGMLVSNMAVELKASPHWSFTLPVYFSAWDYFSSTVKFRTFTLQPEARYWFSEKEGWFAGAHAGLAYYNFAWGGKWRVQDYDCDSPALGGGLSGGCRWPFGKQKRWLVECSLGVSVYRLHYSKFHNRPNGLLARSEKKTFWGIDQAAITLAYMFNLHTRKVHAAL